MFKFPLRLDGADAQKLKELIDADVEAFFNETVADMTPAERKKWKPYYPYTVIEDDDGNATGGILFHFKQNAKIRLKDGTTKDVTIQLKDSADADMHKPIYGGSVGRVKYTTRGIKMVSKKEAGVRLDFSGVQIKKLMGGSGASGFGTVEDGYVEDDGEGGSASASPPDHGADY